MTGRRLILILLLIVPAAIFLSIRPEEMTPGFFSDEAVYYAMTRSLAEDGDLTWTRADMEAVCERYPAAGAPLPSGPAEPVPAKCVPAVDE